MVLVALGVTLKTVMSVEIEKGKISSIMRFTAEKLSLQLQLRQFLLQVAVFICGFATK